MLQSAAEHVSALLTNDEFMMNRLKDEWLAEGGNRFGVAILILASINVAAAVLTIGSMIYQAWSKKEWDFYPKTRGYFNSLPTVHPAEVFPIIFATMVILQGIVIIVISAIESHKTILTRCSTVAPIVWPVLWVGPYTMLVFGLETTFRSLQSTAFSSQGRWHVLVRIIGVLLLTIITGIPSLVLPASGQCLASFIWSTAHYAKPGVVIGLTLIFAYITCASVITFQLMTTSKLHSDQRIQASRIVYYLLVSTLLLSLIVPFYVQVIMSEAAIITSKMAEVAANLAGIIPGLLYILLRSNANWTMIQPIGTFWSRKRSLRLSGSPNIDVYDHMTSPVSSQTENSPKLMHDPEALLESSRQLQFSETQMQVMDCAIQQQPPKPKVVLPPKATLTRPHTQHRANYSIFPTQDMITARESVSTTFSQEVDEELELPKPLFAYSHKLELSRQSNTTSATVEIGLRLSLPNHPLTPIEQSPVENGPDPPLGSTPTSSPSPIRGMLSSRSDGSKKPSLDIAILPIQPNEARTPSQILSPRSNLLSPSWIFRKGDTLGSGRRQCERDMMKRLPPVPVDGTSLALHPQGSANGSKLGWNSETRSQAWL